MSGRDRDSTRNVVENAIDARKKREPWVVLKSCRVEKNLSTEETRRFWAHAEKKAALVATWPEWKKGGVVLPEEK